MFEPKQFCVISRNGKQIVCVVTGEAPDYDGIFRFIGIRAVKGRPFDGRKEIVVSEDKVINSYFWKDDRKQDENHTPPTHPTR